MKFFNKLKNLFFEEEIIEAPSESIKEEITCPPTDNKEQIKDNVEDIISERELFKSETTFKFPVIFKEEDFIEEKRVNKNENVLDVEVKKIREQQQKESTKTKPPFKVSPVISPVYGILDKNYKKEDITPREASEMKETSKERKVDVDDVRKKAYGSLTDEIEQELDTADNKGMFFNLKSDDEKDDIDDTNLLYEMSEKGANSLMKDIAIGDAEENYKDFGLEYSIDHQVKEVTVEQEEDNLFDLIDSMYEDEAEDEEE